MSIEVINLEYDVRNNLITGDNGDVYSEILQLIPKERLDHLKKNGGMEYLQDVRPDVWYVVEFPIPDDLELITLYYDIPQNIMMDGLGYIVFNIYNYVTPSQLMMFKHYKKDMTFQSVDGRKVELIYSW